MTSFFLPVALIQSRTRSSSQEFKPVRSIEDLIRVDRLYLLNQRLTLGEGGREQGRHIEDLGTLGEHDRVPHDRVVGVDAPASSCKY